MTRRYKVVHRTVMRYAGEVTASHNELRMIPLGEADQTTLEARVKVRPLTWSHVYTDHWGSEVMAIESQTPHDILEIEATSLVERSTDEVDEDAAEVGGWAALTTDVADRFSEYLDQTTRTAPPSELAELAEQIRSRSATPHDAAVAVCELLQTRLELRPGTTTVQDGGAEAWIRGGGACQDVTHLALGALRAIGVPARYVGGYTTRDGEVPLGQSAPGDNHAWIECWDGEWRPLDLASSRPVAGEHVVVARGRDYDDVAPFRGMYAGPALEELSVDIEFTRLT